MPVWYYIDGCPLPEECCRRQTTDKKKKLTFCGPTVRAARTKCCNHLVGSDLHNKKRSKAWEIAEAQEIKTYEEETDDDAPPPPGPFLARGGRGARFCGGYGAHWHQVGHGRWERCSSGDKLLDHVRKTTQLQNKGAPNKN